MNSDEARAYFARLRRAMVQNAMRILDQPDAVVMKDAQHFQVVSLRTPGRRVGVHQRGDLWRCTSDKRNTSDNPCSHILAVQITVGEIERPNTAANVWMKGDEGRNHALEEEAWRRIPVRVPELLAQLLQEGLPSIVDVGLVDGHERKGRLRKPIYGQCYQAVVRVLERTNLRGTQGRMEVAQHRIHNPYGGASRSTMSRFHIDHGNELLMQKLLALSTWPARPYETLVHPDGTGLTEQHFTAYFDERYAKGRRKQKAKREGKKDGDDGPRKHHWTYAEILWTYRYTMVAAIHTQQGPFGEAPWLIPLLERAKMMLNVGEVGGDKAYNAYYLDEYLARQGIDSQIKVKDNANPTYSNARKKDFKRRVEDARVDPEGFAAKANRRNNAETGNHAFKAILGDQIYSKDPLAQRVEILCMCVAYNLMRLVYLEAERGIQVSFAGGARSYARPLGSTCKTSTRPTRAAPRPSPASSTRPAVRRHRRGRRPARQPPDLSQSGAWPAYSGLSASDIPPGRHPGGTHPAPPPRSYSTPLWETLSRGNLGPWNVLPSARTSLVPSGAAQAVE